MGDLRTTVGEEMPLSRKESKKRKWVYTFLFLIIAGCIIAAGIYIKVDRFTIAQGYVTTEEYAEVRPPVTGTVSKIYIKTGAQVQAGQVLVQLNSEEEEATLAETKARHAKLETELERRMTEMNIDLERRKLDLDEQKRTHVDNVEIAELRLRNSQTKLKLTRELVEKGLKAATNLEDDMLAEQLAEVTLTSLKKKDFTLYEKLLKLDREKYDCEIKAIQNELKALGEAVERAEARLRTRQIRAPIAGVVVRYEFVIGELIQPTTVIYEIFGGERQTLKLRVNERYSMKVAEGQPYRAKLSSFRGLQNVYFRGELQYLKNVIQADGSSTYRVVYCSFDPGEHVIPPGTTAEARIYYGKSCLWFYLFNVDL